MLTAALVRARVRGREIHPELVDPTRKDLLEAAEELVALPAQALEEGWTLGTLRAQLEEVGATHRSHKVIRGLAKLVVDRCEADVEAPLPPRELRAEVFRAARARAPLALRPDALGRPTAADVLAEVGARHGLSAEVLARALYADLPEAQVVVTWRPLDAQALLHRYNVALVQALLLRAVDVRITLHGPSVGKVRQLLRHVKFQQLVHAARREGSLLHLELDGPCSLFKQSTRYGLQLARFFPALLLQEVPWRLEAEVEWTRAAHRKRLELTHEHGLRSHLADTGAWEPRERRWFVERWEAAGDTGWTMTEDTLPIELGGHGVVLPDFTFRKDGREAHLDLVGFWRRGWLERRLEGLTRHGPGNLVLAVSRSLAGSTEGLDELAGEVIPFAQVVPVREVLAALERVAR
ncbi:MAG: DUF790 family protein [Alphaproteobacteria bacterium]|nr:DUF790 family protein [Alphaproteobacteria bacterium]